MMTDRRTFLGSLLAPLLGWFRKKPAPTVELRPNLRPGLFYFAELPDRIENLTVVQNKLYAFTASGMYEVFADGRIEKLDYQFAVPVPPLNVSW